MDGAEGTALLLDDVEGPKTLLVYCGGEGEEQETQPAGEPRRDLQLEADLDLRLPLTLDNDEYVWLLVSTIFH